MTVKLVSISPPSIPSALASAEVELIFDHHSKLTTSDLRVFRNNAGQLWLGMPMRNVKGTFVQVVSGSRLVQRLVEDVVLPAYEAWAKQQAAAQIGGAR